MEELILCCICLYPPTNPFVHKTSACDSKGVQWLQKLIFSVPEIEWKENWVLCGNCSAKLDGVYEFKLQCIDSEMQRKSHSEDKTVNEDLVSNDKLKMGVRKLTEIRIKKKETKPNLSSSFESNGQLSQHMQATRKSDLDVQALFTCNECNGTFNSSSNLMQHKKYHQGKRTHICSYCGKGFITKGDLKVHEKHHLNKREYECDVCAKRFNTHKDIRSHKLVVHTDPKHWTHVCSYCAKRFPIKSNLDLHIRRHTGDKPFVCHLCEKKFVEKIVLQKHIKSHSNVRAFKCTECDKKYKDKKILEIHMKKVHDLGDAKVPVRIKKYFCSICPKSYFAKNKLVRHMCSHTGVKPFCCEICQKKFTDKSYVKQHLKTVHNLMDKIND